MSDKGNVKISVIVPVYKTEKYLERCVDSILGQAVEEMEVILIDDGSPDGCPQICDRYRDTDSRIIVIHQNNRGLSAARNAGLKIALGEYIVYVDSDDHLLENCLKPMYELAHSNDIDILIGRPTLRLPVDHARWNNGVPMNKALKSEDMLILLLQRNNIKFSVWRCIYRREVIIRNGIYFKEGIVHEDEQWTPRVYLAADRVMHSEIYHYCYNTRGPSITRRNDRTQNGLDLIGTCKEMEKFYKGVENKELKKYLNDYLGNLYIYASIHCGLYNKGVIKFSDRLFVVGKPIGIRNRLKCILFIILPGVYSKIYKRMSIENPVFV